MLAGFFTSGAVALVGLLLIALEAAWLARRYRHQPNTRRAWMWFLLAGGALLSALLAGLRDWPWPWLALFLTLALVGHVGDLRARLARQ